MIAPAFLLMRARPFENAATFLAVIIRESG
jgi:hypothetical protein